MRMIIICHRPLFTLFILFILLLAVCVQSSGIAAAGSGYQIEIIKSLQELRLKRGNDVMYTFRIAYGKGEHGPKQQRGDNRTPVGSYQILDFKTDSKFHYFMQLNYPNLLDAWHGYKNRLISPAEYREIARSFKKHEMPPQDTYLGGQIGIHGLGVTTREKLKIHQSVNWTEGCIAITNEDMNVLRKYVSKGMPVVIME